MSTIDEKQVWNSIPPIVRERVLLGEIIAETDVAGNDSGTE